MKHNRPLRTHWDRFIDKTAEGPVPDFDPSLGPCLLWTGAVMESGYGLFYSPSGMTAHRFAYEHEHGELPDTMETHHRCRVRPCVNVEHLVALTVADHMKVHRVGGVPRRGELCWVCEIEPVFARGLCQGHYVTTSQLRPHIKGTRPNRKAKPKGPCRVCGELSFCRDLCRPHYEADLRERRTR